MAVQSKDLFLTQQEIEEQRLRNFAIVFGRVDSTLAGRDIGTALVNSPAEAPAWSDGQKITFNRTRIGDVTDTHNLVSLMGLNYHELAHLLWTPRSHEYWMQNLANSGRFKAFNILEDQRIETLLTSLYGATKSYLKALFLEHSLNLPNADYETLHLLTWGRRHLGTQIRQTLVDSFRRPDLLQKTKDIIDEYRVIGVGISSNRRAAYLIEEFHKIMEDMANDGDGGAAEQSCLSAAQQTSGTVEVKEQRAASNKAQSKKEEERDEDEEYVGSSTSDESESDEDRDRENTGQQEDTSESSSDSPEEGSDSSADDWDDDDEEESSDSADMEDDEDLDSDGTDDDESEEDSGGDVDLGDEDEDQSGGDDSEVRDGSEGSLDSAADSDDDDDSESGDSAGDSHGQGESSDGEGHGDSSAEGDEGGGTGAGNEGGSVPENLTEEEVRGLLQAFEEELKNALKESLASIKAVQENIVRPSGARIPPANLQRMSGNLIQCTPEMIAEARQVGNEFRRLVNDSDPGWTTHRDSGRINVRRAMHADSYDDVFDQWNEGNQLASDMEVVIGLDVSGSMQWRILQASRALWITRRAIETIGQTSRVSTFAFHTDSYILTEPGEKALPDRFLSYGTSGSTDPTDLLTEARRIFQVSKKAHKILIMITDGSWSRNSYRETPQATYDESIQIMNRAGVLTGVLFTADDNFVRLYGSPDQDEMYKRFGHYSKIFEQTRDVNQIKNFSKKMVTLAMKTAR